MKETLLSIGKKDKYLRFSITSKKNVCIDLGIFGGTKMTIKLNNNEWKYLKNNINFSKLYE